MDESVFQKIFDLIQDFLPETWTKMVLFAGYTGGSYSIKFYCKQGIDDAFVDCFHLDGVSRADLIKLFMKLDKELSQSRRTLEKDKQWSVFTMMVDHAGTMKTDFDYQNHSEDMVSYEREWKEKYL